jgi:hypothetical protein
MVAWRWSTVLIALAANGRTLFVSPQAANILIEKRGAPSVFGNS